MKTLISLMLGALTLAPMTSVASGQYNIQIGINGMVKLNGQKTIPTELAKALDQAKVDNAVVEYYRASSPTSPTPAAKQVLKMINERGLTVTMSSPEATAEVVR